VIAEPVQPLLLVWAAALGLIAGSYLNVVVHRLPRGASTVLPRSRCPWCGGAIAARDNLPLLSFLLLRGRCRRCGGPIGWRYPLVEAVTAAAFVLCVARWGPRPEAAAAALFCCLLIALAAIDVEHLLLPDRLTLPGVAAGWALQRWLPGATLLEALVGAFLGAGLLLLVGETWAWLRGEEGMGLGDAKMLAMVGAFLGWKGVLMTLFVGCLLGAVWGVALLALRRAGPRTRLPFGAFLAAGALVALFAGPAPLDAYLARL
jgi:leader peptidase (prepilin peptidase)/N-methyltransferase